MSQLLLWPEESRAVRVKRKRAPRRKPAVQVALSLRGKRYRGEVAGCHVASLSGHVATSAWVFLRVTDPALAKTTHAIQARLKRAGYRHVLIEGGLPK